MAENETANVLVKIVELLTPLNSEERQRIVKAALTFLGDDSVSIAENGRKDVAGLDELDFTPRANSWIKQNGLTMEALEEVFHFGQDGVEFIASDVPGKNHKEKTHSAYILCGIQKLLAEGDLNFDDKTARTLCENLGCYNQANHSAYMKSIGNVITGAKNKGWTLTVPGLRKAAGLIQEMVSKK